MSINDSIATLNHEKLDMSVTNTSQQNHIINGCTFMRSTPSNANYELTLAKDWSIISISFPSLPQTSLVHHISLFQLM